MGSPPHGRGTPSGRSRCRTVSGLTPAWAGNTSSGRSRTTRHQGSPPHGRGTPPGRNIGPSRSRLTPAWAGNTRSRTRRAARAGAHPRMGGEHRGPTRPVAAALGLTPAWAGNTASAISAGIRSGAHPRMGGEHLQSVPRPCSSPGSPPHGRGTPRGEGPGRSFVRLTPAWAGNTGPPAYRRRSRWAHPRMGGEHARRRRSASSSSGSPPHGRGTLSVTCWFRRMMTECPVLMDCQDARQAARPTGVRPGR